MDKHQHQAKTAAPTKSSTMMMLTSEPTTKGQTVTTTTDTSSNNGSQQQQQEKPMRQQSAAAGSVKRYTSPRSQSLSTPSPPYCNGAQQRATTPLGHRSPSKQQPSSSPSSLSPHYNRAILRGLTNNSSLLLQAIATLRSNPGEAQRVLELLRSSETPLVAPSGAVNAEKTQWLIALRQTYDCDRHSARLMLAQLEEHFRGIELASVTKFNGEIEKAVGMTAIPSENYIAVVHDTSKVSIFALSDNKSLQMVATFAMTELDRRQRQQPVALSGCIVAMPDQLFFLNERGTRILRCSFELFEAAGSLNAFETRDVIATTMARSVIGCMRGLAVNVKHKELYTSTGDHIVAYSTVTGCELIRSAIVQAPGNVFSAWSNAGVCYGLVGNNNENGAMRIKYFRDHQQDGFDVKIANTKGLAIAQGAITFDYLSNSLLIAANDSLMSLASVSSSNCSATLPSINLVSGLSNLGVTKMTAIAVLEKRQQSAEASNNDDKKDNNSNDDDFDSMPPGNKPKTRSVIVVLDASTSSLFTFS